MATPVIFRKWSKREGGDILALFPDESAGMFPGHHCMSYERVGQHGAADYWHCMRVTKPAKPDEYAPLLQELVAIGYDDLVIRKRKSNVRGRNAN